MEHYRVKIYTLSAGTQQGNNDAENANLFNKFFYSVFTRSSNSTDSDNLTADMVSPLKDLKFSDYEVYNILANLDASKAAGIDGIGPRIMSYHHVILFASCLQSALSNVLYPLSGVST